MNTCKTVTRIEYTRWDGTTYTKPYDAKTWKDLNESRTPIQAELKCVQLIEVQHKQEIFKNTFVITIWINDFTSSIKHTVTTNDPMEWVVDNYFPHEFDDFTYYVAQ